MELCESSFKKITFLSKMGGVVFFAIGTERLVAGEHIISIIFLFSGIAIFFIPFKIAVS